jgi:tetratricopeptide (TPR) repeat protein
MGEYHPNRETLEKFSRGDFLEEEAAWMEAHLRSGCAICLRTIDEILTTLTFVPPPPEPGASDDWNEADDWKRRLSRLEQRIVLIQRERQAAPGLVAELLSRPETEWDGFAQSSRPCRTLAVCEVLIDRSFEEGFLNPAHSVRIAELAIHLAERLDGSRYGSAVVQDMRARAWAYLGNARRLTSDLTGAEQALIRAEALSEEGSADPLEEARILDFKASLLSAQGRFESAVELLEVVIEIYEEVGDPHRKGRALISQGLFNSYAGKSRKAVKQLRQGLALIDRDQEPRLLLMARHNLAWALNDSGKPEEALRQLESIRRSYPEFPDSWSGLRLQWLEGRIAIRLGKLEEAEQRLRAVLARFIEQGLGCNASMVTLDLAGLSPEQL